MVLYGPKKVAEILGVTVQTVYRMVREKQLPAPLHVGRQLRWFPASLESWLKQQHPDS